jgi:acyl carrier protein
MTQDEIFQKVRTVLMDALAVDDDEVKMDAVLTRDLGAESIDFLDIGFKLEQAFGIKIAQGELFPDNVTQDAAYVKDGKFTPQGIAALKAKLPHLDFSRLEADPTLANVANVFTVGALVKFVEGKVNKG